MSQVPYPRPCGDFRTSYCADMTMFRTRGAMWSAWGGFALLLVLPLFASDYVLSQLILIGIYGIAALGLNVLVGFTGQISLGHSAFFCFGAFASAWLGTAHGVPPLISIPIAGLMTKSGTIGYLGSYKVPEVVLGVNAYTLAAQAVNPNIKTKLVMIDSWFDPAKEAAAVSTLINLGCDVVAQHTDSPAGLQVCEQRKAWCFGQGADMKKFAPKTQLTAIEDIWGPYYIALAKALLDGSWKSDDAWWGMKEGTVVISPYSKAMPDNVRAAADKVIAGWKDGTYDVFTGPISDQTGKERVAKGEKIKDGDALVMDWYVQGVQS